MEMSWKRSQACQHDDMNGSTSECRGLSRECWEGEGMLLTMRSYVTSGTYKDALCCTDSITKASLLSLLAALTGLWHHTACVHLMLILNIVSMAREGQLAWGVSLLRPRGVWRGMIGEQAETSCHRVRRRVAFAARHFVFRVVASVYRQALQKFSTIRSSTEWEREG